MTENVSETPLATAEETSEFVEAQVKEYGTFVAIAPISFNGIPAYNIGDPVPVSNVERYNYERDNLVARIDNEAGQRMIREIHESTQQAMREVPVQQPVSLGVPVLSEEEK